MPDRWFLKREDRVHGPYTLAQMQQFAGSNNLLNIDLVKREGGEQWVPAHTVTVFHPVDPPAPPPAQGITAEKAPGRSWPVAVSSALILWQQLSPWKKVAVIALGLLALALWAYGKFTGGGTKSVVEILLETGVISGVVGLVFKVLERKLLGKRGSEQQESDGAGTGTPRPGPARPIFVGLTAVQWIVTLYVLFFAALAGTVLAALLLGRQSIWITGMAVAVIGGLIAFLSRSYQEIGISERLTEGDYKWSVMVGSSALFPVALSLVLGCVVNPTWFYAAYAAVVFLPAIHVVQRFSQVMEPIRSSSGLWIAGSYLGAMVVGSSVLAVVLSRPVTVPDEVRETILGTWVEAGAGEAKIEFTKGGQALVSHWDDIYRSDDDFKYQFDSASQLTLFSRHSWDRGRIEILSKGEIAVNLHGDNKRFVRPDEKQPTDTSRFVGRWVSTPDEGSAVPVGLQRQSSAEFTKGGMVVIELYGDKVEPLRYRFVKPSLVSLHSEQGTKLGSALLTSDDEMTLTYGRRVFDTPTIKRLARADAAQQKPKGNDNEPKDERPRSETVEIDSKFVGTWELHAGGNKQGTMTITKGGRYVYDGASAASFGGRPINESAGVRPGPKGGLVLKSGVMVGDAGVIEFVSENELLLTSDKYSHIPSGTLKRRKEN